MGRTGTDWSGVTNRAGSEQAVLTRTQQVKNPHSVHVGVGCEL